MIAARVAAQLARDPDLRVRREKGRFGELRVSVDGLDAVDSNPFLYPTPTSVVAKVRSHLVAAVPSHDEVAGSRYQVGAALRAAAVSTRYLHKHGGASWHY